MSPARWQQVKAVLGVALESGDPDARDRYLASACTGDPELRREVVALLEQTTGALGIYADRAGPTSAVGAEEPSAWAIPGRLVGAWELERELGRGGMGSVWLARRVDGRFEQSVAIKLLKRGTDTEEVLRRFRGERQILARLEHPNIARLLDGGETAEGLPFLAMEYVAGERITDFARARHWNVPARVALFRRVCAAVEFAHQNLIVHRDLKPGNILVTADGEPKLLDFGIAKLLDPEADAAVTRAEDRRLTPAYASPEQLRGDAITTASDVYSLGALLYELLSGQPPHHLRTGDSSPAGWTQAILEAEPIRPSALAADAESRRRLRGDLEVVILRALAKEPSRRYGSVRAFSDDLRRWQEGFPVHARPDSWSYRTRKFVARHKLAVAATVVTWLAVAGGAAATLWQARRAERRFQEVRTLAKLVLFEMDDAIAPLPGATHARTLLVTHALRYLDGLARDGGDDRELQLELTAAYLKVGDVQGRPYHPNLGDAAGALKSYARAAALAEPWAQAESDWNASPARLMLCQARERMGEVAGRLGQRGTAAEWHRRALEICQAALAVDAANSDRWRTLAAESLIGLGDAISAANHEADDLTAHREALAKYRAALPFCTRLAEGQAEDSPPARQLAATYVRLANTLAAIGRKSGDRAAFSECFDDHRRSLSLLEAGLRRDPGNVRLRRNLADGLIDRGTARAEAGEELPGGVDDCRRALAIFEPLAAADPSNAEAQQDLSSAHYALGRVLQAQGERAAAAAAYRRCLETLTPLVAAHPENVETSFDLRRAQRGLTEVGAAGAPGGSSAELPKQR